MASKLLARPAVQAILGELSKEKLEKLDVSSDRILLEVSRIAFIDPRKMFDGEGNLIPVEKLDAATAATISYIDHDELFQYFGKGERKRIGTTTKVRLSDKTKALEMLCRYKALFNDKVEHIVKDEPKWDLDALSDQELEIFQRLAEKSTKQHGGIPESDWQ